LTLTQADIVQNHAVGRGSGRFAKEYLLCELARGNIAIVSKQQKQTGRGSARLVKSCLLCELAQSNIAIVNKQQRQADIANCHAADRGSRRFVK